MFLFKLTLPVLGTATLGAVGTGIYYGVETWGKNGGQKDKKLEKEGSSLPQEESEALTSQDSHLQEESTSPPEPQPPSLSTVEVVIEQDEDQK